MEFDEVVQKRRSVRLYDAQKKVLKNQIEEMITTAQQAPSWKNSQTARYYVILDEAVRERVRECLMLQNQVVTKDVNALLVTTFVKNRSGFTREGVSENELGNGWGCYDLGLQNAYLVLKAADMGIDSVILGLRDAQALRGVLPIGDDEEVGPVIALGYRKEPEIQSPRRKPLAEIVHFYE